MAGKFVRREIKKSDIKIEDLPKITEEQKRKSLVLQEQLRILLEKAKKLDKDSPRQEIYQFSQQFTKIFNEYKKLVEEINEASIQAKLYLLKLLPPSLQEVTLERFNEDAKMLAQRELDRLYGKTLRPIEPLFKKPTQEETEKATEFYEAMVAETEKLLKEINESLDEQRIRLIDQQNRLEAFSKNVVKLIEDKEKLESTQRVIKQELDKIKETQEAIIAYKRELNKEILKQLNERKYILQVLKFAIEEK